MDRGGFIMPEKREAPEPHRTDVWLMPPGEERANERSKTPSGFAQAVFLANAPHLKKRNAAQQTDFLADQWSRLSPLDHPLSDTAEQRVIADSRAAESFVRI